MLLHLATNNLLINASFDRAEIFEAKQKKYKSAAHQEIGCQIVLHGLKKWPTKRKWAQKEHRQPDSSRMSFTVELYKYLN